MARGLAAALPRAGLTVALVVAACAPAPTAPQAAASAPVSTVNSGGWQQISCVSAIGSPPDASDEPGFPLAGWRTDFAKHCVPLSEITSGGPPPDGIPSLDRPIFYAIAFADDWLQPQEPVIAVFEGEAARAYPLQILLWHEIVNDTIAGRPVAVTFCPLCNTALVFDRRVDGRALTFGTTGNLRFSDLVMYDRETQSWWQQATGEAIVGEHTGKRLRRITAPVLSYEEFKKAYPKGEVLSREAAKEETRDKVGSARHYGQNPYVGYDRADTPPLPFFWGDRPIDARLLPKARVAVATFARPAVAYPIDHLRNAVAVNDTIAGRRVVLLYLSGVASPLDRRQTGEGVDVGQAALFDPVVDGRALTFRGGGTIRAPTFSDVETGSTWLVSGVAVEGPLKGRRLAMLDHTVTFWFIWAVFQPDTEVRRP